MLKGEPITAARLREVLNYDPETGEFSRRIAVGPRGRWRAGSAAGTTNGAGYRQIRVDGCPYYAHHLAWLWMTSEWPREIDHINHDSFDNRWGNLREATRSQNLANTGVPAHNTSSFKGVSWNKHLRRWRAQIQVNSIRRDLGHFDTPAKAWIGYTVAARKHFGPFARVGPGGLLSGLDPRGRIFFIP